MYKIWFRYKQDPPGTENYIESSDIEVLRKIYDALDTTVIWTCQRP